MVASGDFGLLVVASVLLATLRGIIESPSQLGINRLYIGKAVVLSISAFMIIAMSHSYESISAFMIS